MNKKLQPGDIFEVKLGSLRKYFQFIYKDDEYMAGHLIRAFDYSTEEEASPNIQDILNAPILFYTYTRVIEGMKDNLWKKIANRQIGSSFEPPTFRQTNDHTPKSFNWFIWKEKFANKKVIGELTEKYKKLPVSAIYPPSAIVNWMKTGNSGFKEPS